MLLNVRKLMVVRFIVVLLLLSGMFGAAPDKQAWAAPAGLVLPGVTVRVSVTVAGEQADGYSFYPSISANGRYVAFESTAANLVAGDTNEVYDVFVRDMDTGIVTRVSVDSSGVEGNSYSEDPSISADGRYIAFDSDASNLVTGDINETRDIFVHDMQTGETTLVSVNSSGEQTDQPSSMPALSADGRIVAFQSNATNLAPGDNGTWNIYVHDLQTGGTSRVSVGMNGTLANASSELASVSADGRYVAFFSYASNLVPGDTNDQKDVFVYDLWSGVTTRVSVAAGGVQANDYSEDAMISADGRYVAFESVASNLVPGDTNGTTGTDIFVHDRQTGQTRRVSVDSNGVQPDGLSWDPSISGDGRFVVFVSDATNLVPGGTNAVAHIYAHDLLTGITTLASVNSNGESANEYYSAYPVISTDGQSIAFQSDATNLAADDTNQNTDVFVHWQEILPPSATTLYLSLANSQTVEGIPSADEDILLFDGTHWSLFFDGSDVGVKNSDLVAFSIVDADTILMSFSSNVKVNGFTATPQDILQFDATSLGSNTAGTFSLYFDGSDVGLNNPTNEKIDALSLLPGGLLISTTGNPNVSGLTTGQDEDVLAFTPTSLGNVTSGTWSMYFDGSDVGLSDSSNEDTDALDVVDGDVYLSTTGSFSVSGLSGADEDVFVCAATSLGDVTACDYSTSLFFDGSSWGLADNDVDAFSVRAAGNAP